MYWHFSISVGIVGSSCIRGIYGGSYIEIEGITNCIVGTVVNACVMCGTSAWVAKERQQEGHDDPVLLHWLIRKIPSYQTLQYSGIALKHKTPKTGLKLVVIALMF